MKSESQVRGCSLEDNEHTDEKDASDFSEEGVH